MPSKHPFSLLIALALVSAIPPNVSGATTPDSARKALLKATRFFDQEVSYQGAYVYRYSADLKLQEGERRTGRTSGWTEPPGSPYVGEALLEAHRLTGDPELMKAATRTAMALVRTQLRSGGWDSRFELGESDRKRHAYRTEEEQRKQLNVTTLDDNKTQSCLRFLMHLDKALGFKNKEIRNTLDHAWNSLFGAQHPNGAWPQRFSEPLKPTSQLALKARFPETWSRTYPKKKYDGYYTLNDNTMTDMVELLLEAHQIYGEDRFLLSAFRTGEFLIRAQLPMPQPGWAQQYNHMMEPAWARKFEPPAVTGGESQGVMRSLMLLYQHTGNKKFLDPIPSALAYYKSSLRSDGKLARFYELRTNKPLYFTKDYKLTYSDADMPTHYGFIVGSKLKDIEARYNDLLETPKASLKPSYKPKTYRMSSSLEKRAVTAIKSMDKRGAWIEKGSLKNFGSEGENIQVIETKTFAKNLLTLAQYISAASKK